MRVLFGVSSVGLGHVRRSIAIAKGLRDLGNFEIEWVSSEPGISLISGCGERVIPVSKELTSLSRAMEEGVMNGRLDDMSKVARKSSNIAKQNYSILKKHLVEYDVIVQDEFAETMFSFMWDKKPVLPSRKAIVTDYYRFKTFSRNPIDKVVMWYANRMLARVYRNSSVRIFADDLDSIPERLRSSAQDEFEIVGPIVGEAPKESRANLRKKLFPYLKGDKILLITVGGTATGKALLDFVVSNSNEITNTLGMSIVLLLGSRVERSIYPEDSEILSFVPFTPNTLEFFKAADCVVTQAGASTLNEVASIGTPCVSVPISNHWEQEANAQRYRKKFGFGIVNYSSLDFVSFTRAVQKSMKSEYEPADFRKGVERSARLIFDLAEGT